MCYSQPHIHNGSHTCICLIADYIWAGPTTSHTAVFTFWHCHKLGYACAGVLVGLLALGESLPSSPSQRYVRLLSWLLIALGVALLANGQGQHAAPFVS